MEFDRGLSRYPVEAQLEGKVWVERVVKLKDEELKMKCFKDKLRWN